MRKGCDVLCRIAGYWFLLGIVSAAAMWLVAYSVYNTDSAKRSDASATRAEQDKAAEKAEEAEEEGRLKAVAAIIERNSKRLDDGQVRALAQLIVDECDRQGLDPMLVLAVIKAESGFSTRAVSVRGAVGLMQVMPSTASFISQQMGMEYKGRASLHDPITNVKLGIYYLGMLRERYSSIERALVAYNFGPNKAIVKRGNLEQRPPSYVRKVMRYKSELEDESREI